MQTRSRLPIIDTSQATITISKAGQGYNPNRADIIVPSGGTSNEDYINLAGNKLSTYGGGKIILLEGEFIIDGNINLGNNVTCEGQGYKTTIKIRDGINANVNMFNGGASFRIRNMQLNGNNTNRVGMVQHAINITNGGSHAHVEDVLITDVHDEAIVLNNCTYISIFHNAFLSNGNAGFGDLFIANSDARYCNIFYNSFLNSQRRSIYHVGSYFGICDNIINDNITNDGIYISNTASYNIIDRNRIKSGPQWGINCNGITNLIRNNRITQCLNGINVSNSYNSIANNYIGIIGNDGINISNTYNFINNNWVASTNNDGISINSTNNEVIGNHILFLVRHGISFTSSINNINNNYIHSAGQRGIYGNGGSYSNISDNLINTSSYEGILLTGSSYSNIIGNSVRNSSQALNNTYDNIMLTTDSDFNNVQCNKCTNTGGANQPRYGINIATADCNSNLVTNNDLINSGATGSLNDAGTGTITIAGNRL